MPLCFSSLIKPHSAAYKKIRYLLRQQSRERSWRPDLFPLPSSVKLLQLQFCKPSSSSVCRVTFHVSTCFLFALRFGSCGPEPLGTEDSYTVTCGMPLPCLADAQKNNSGLYCLGTYHTSKIYIHLSALPHKAVTQTQRGPSWLSVDV